MTLFNDLARRFFPAIPSVDSAYGIKLAENTGDWTYKFYVRGSYGFYFSDYLKSVDEPFVFLDIGANQGLYAVIAALNPNCRKVHAFEPVADTAVFLKRNLRLNRCRSVRVHRAAVSDHVGTAQITLRQDHSGAASLEGMNGRKLDEPGRVIEIKTLSAAELQRKIGTPRARVIVKIDVEGHEEVVLAQLMQCAFFDRVTDLFYECNESWISPQRIETSLRARGFTRFDRQGEGTHYDIHVRR
ncbi:FkbM family methyltransferase [Ruegeria pomeroyi]|uniref:FkbM family methyltransferase n=1 Tax=Ruegeria alba TaxID=2916756 RepID=A0ABS9NW64_9RHOB|nr:FkbM family methyltransferase [Ruegeria alba]MCE8513586.1 FkbM family methyltransferase [Ruegeria pomeroyi]MCE8521251.1 FkbM family methyltransferase [Ruegeria pomeroyi]MCE8525815.1 FkbM family methyltransferase [Ruegeria pomeroyi]MCE8529157.1 FkbM family methyltransferase [Ruegeria pomeroyi]MCE8533368.1 FkbM family methyltransferase [Ruegeria pomeroyi]